MKEMQMQIMIPPMKVEIRDSSSSAILGRQWKTGLKDRRDDART